VNLNTQGVTTVKILVSALLVGAMGLGLVPPAHATNCVKLAVEFQLDVPGVGVVTVLEDTPGTIVSAGVPNPHYVVVQWAYGRLLTVAGKGNRVVTPPKTTHFYQYLKEC
jgi:hypothetical protein